MEEFAIRKKAVNVLVDRHHGFSTEFHEWITKTPYSEVEKPENFDLVTARKRAKIRIIPKSEELIKDINYELEYKNLKPFERLVLKNMIAVNEGRINYTKYMYNLEKNYTIDDLLGDLYGEDFLPRFLKMLHSFEYKRQKDVKEYNKNQINISEKKAVFEPIKERVFVDFKKYMLNKMHFEKPFKDVLQNGLFKNIVLDDNPLGYSYMGDDYYNHNLDGIKIWRQSSNTYLVDISYMASTIFHEFAGHLGRETYSENLPSSLTYTTTLNYTPVTHPPDEGLAFELEGEARTFSGIRNTLFLISNKGKILKASKLTPEEKIESDKTIQFGMKQNFFYRYFMLNVLRKQDNPGRDDREETSHFLNKKIPKYAAKNDVYHPLNWGKNILTYKKYLINSGYITLSDDYLIPYWMGYPKGIMFMKDFKRNIDKKYGKGFYENHEKLMRDILLTGSWSWQVFPKFADYALKHKSAFYKFLRK